LLEGGIWGSIKSINEKKEKKKSSLSLPLPPETTGHPWGRGGMGWLRMKKYKKKAENVRSADISNENENTKRKIPARSPSIREIMGFKISG